MKTTRSAVLAILFLLPIVRANIIINEIMAQPQDDEFLNEWIELHNNGTQAVDVLDWIIGDDSSNDTLEGGLFNKSGTTIPAFGFAIITDEATRVYNNFNVSPQAIKLYVDDSAIGNGLKNSGETLSLYDKKNNLTSKVTYDQVERGLSRARQNGTFLLATPTPGFFNNGSIVEFMGPDCDWKVELIFNNSLFKNQDEFEWRLRATKIGGNKTNLTATATVTDLFGNLIRSYNPFTEATATAKKTSSKFSPNLPEGKAYVLQANLQTQCVDASLGNNQAEEVFSILSTTKGNQSILSLDQVYDLGTDKAAKFGQIVRLKITAYRGDTDKKVITTWIENKDYKITKQSKFEVENKFSEQSLTLPLQIKANCNKKYDDDEYKIIVKGLGAQLEREIKVGDLTDDLCVGAQAARPDKLEVDILDFPLITSTNQEIPIKVLVENNDEAFHTITMWSYVYRGSKSYSGERERNQKTYRLTAEQGKTITLKNIVEEAPAGEYGILVRYIKDNQATIHSLNEKITLQPNKEETVILEQENQEIEDILPPLQAEFVRTQNIQALSTPVTIYESPSFKTKQVATYLFIALLVVYSVALTIKKELT